MFVFRSLFPIVAGVLIGLACGPVATDDTVEAQILQPPRTVVKTCNVSPTFGTLKGAWEEWLVFEDSAGTLRSVDGACEVRHMIRRQ